MCLLDWRRQFTCPFGLTKTVRMSLLDWRRQFTYSFGLTGTVHLPFWTDRNRSHVPWTDGDSSRTPLGLMTYFTCPLDWWRQFAYSSWTDVDISHVPWTEVVHVSLFSAYLNFLSKYGLHAALNWKARWFCNSVGDPVTYTVLDVATIRAHLHMTYIMSNMSQNPRIPSPLAVESTLFNCHSPIWSLVSILAPRGNHFPPLGTDRHLAPTATLPSVQLTVRSIWYSVTAVIARNITTVLQYLGRTIHNCISNRCFLMAAIPLYSNT